MSDNPGALVRVELMHPETNAPTWWQEWDGERVSTGPLPGADPDAGDPDAGGPVPASMRASSRRTRAERSLLVRVHSAGTSRFNDRPGYRRIRWVDRSGGDPVERSEVVRCLWSSHWQEERVCPAIVRAYEDRCKREAEEHQAALLGMSNEAIRAEVAAANEGIENAHRAANGKWTEALHDRRDAESARMEQTGGRTHAERKSDG